MRTYSVVRFFASTFPERCWLVALVYAALFLSVVLPVAVGLRSSEASFDEGRCYLPAITQMRTKFPSVDLLQDSLSASPPGYSHLLAGLSLATGDSLPAHRAWHVLLSLAGALFLLWLTVTLTGLRSTAMAAMLPMVCSGYYLKSSATLTTDNPGLVLSFVALLFVFFAPERPRSAVLAGVVGLATVWVRHISVWLAAPMILKSLLVYCHEDRRTAAAWLVTALMILFSVAGLVWAWGGLVPPLWSNAHGGLSLSSTVYALALAGIFGAAFLYTNGHVQLRSSDSWAIAAGVVAGAVAFFLADMTPSYEAGRFGGPLWVLAGKVLLVDDRAYMFLPLSAAGAGLLAFAVWRLYEKSPDFALLWAGSFGAWLTTGIVNRQVFHRYYEGPILGFWGLWILLMAVGDSGGRDKKRVGLLYLLAGLLFVSGAYSMFTSVTGFAAPLNQTLGAP